jgi:hypothetical protein
MLGFTSPRPAIQEISKGEISKGTGIIIGSSLIRLPFDFLDTKIVQSSILNFHSQPPHFHYPTKSRRPGFLFSIEWRKNESKEEGGQPR